MSFMWSLEPEPELESIRGLLRPGPIHLMSKHTKFLCLVVLDCKCGAGPFAAAGRALVRWTMFQVCWLFFC